MNYSVRVLVGGLLLVLASGCATTKKTYLANHLGADSPAAKVLPVEFIPQEKNMCGPSVLKMATAADAPDYSLEQLKQMTFREEAQGSFKADILSSARRMGLAPYRVPNLSAMFAQIEGGRPVIVFQNLGLSWMAAWHFALLVGYDANAEEVYLHTGQTAAERMPLKRFIGTWERGEMWSYVILPAQEIPVHSELQEATDNALLFEKLNRPDLAKKIYRASITKFPESFEPHLGLASLYFNEQNLKAAISESQAALKLSPDHPALLFNLSYLYFEAGQKQKAHTFKQRTLASVPDAERDEYLKRFTF